LLRTVLGEFGSVLLTGQRVFPRRLLSEGFQFGFPTLQEALADLISGGLGAHSWLRTL
jgi:NAD dependent epimerase/dehydratase family enzyme